MTKGLSAIDSAPHNRVLFVSADADLRAAATRTLQAAGYQVRAVPHSGHALLLCRTTQFDVIVAELHAPDMSGPMLADHLRRHCPGLATVYLAAPGAQASAGDVIGQPFTSDDLLAHIDLAINGVAA